MTQGQERAHTRESERQQRLSLQGMCSLCELVRTRESERPHAHPRKEALFRSRRARWGGGSPAAYTADPHFALL